MSESEQKVIEFRGYNSEKIVNDMNLWLQNNRNCRFHNIANFSNKSGWRVLALVECHPQFTNYPLKEDKDKSNLK